MRDLSVSKGFVCLIIIARSCNLMIFKYIARTIFCAIGCWNTLNETGTLLFGCHCPKPETQMHDLPGWICMQAIANSKTTNKAIGYKMLKSRQ